ncbi:MAG: 4Fe-4S binding protein [Clostridiales bacterium]|nr:4Fe-4S binding protein [Clostridiales bacterium]
MTEKMMVLKSVLIEQGRQLGFPIIGITGAQLFQSWYKALEKRKDLDPEAVKVGSKVTANPQDIMPDAKAVVVAVYPYKPYLDDFPPGTGAYSAYYMEYPSGRKAAIQLSEVITKEGYDAVVNPPLPLKAAAYRAGLGWFGRNGVIYTREYGSWVALNLILTNAPLPLDTRPQQESLCGKCTLCVEACPVNAITDDGAVLPGYCMRSYMISPGFVPVNIREKIGNKFLGCDICQTVCPWNRKGMLQARPPSNEDIQAFNIFSILKGWCENDRKPLERLANVIGRNYARSQRVLSTAVIVAGNTGNPEYIPLLAKTLKHSYPPIRGHSAWALGKIGSEHSREALSEALKNETDTQVIQEIQSAIQRINCN